MPKDKSQHFERKKDDTRVVKIPAHRYSPLQKQWMEIYTPIVEMCKLECRVNLKARAVEIRTGPQTEDRALLTKAVDFVRAFLLGFDTADAVALLRLDDVYVDSFEVKDVKILHGDHLSRAIGRLSGTDGKTRFTLENATTTRIVIADTKIHLMGTVQNIKVARRALSELIRGSPAAKVYNSVRGKMNRINEAF
eukprot:NODE_4514_length_777_cov_50.360000_g4491_i0.p1 GENE.NODE_4514_length_777_cov_50.360000_g4491_i0~~NODE_4514_length_777_cov_50.360000_g4491_i0.p1  ORF type:complete len:194 (+),score=30.94 NODE_4514_length_777_cov_50.360000_g4491_i0:69-650(+)